MTARVSASIRSCGRALHDSLIRCPEYYDHHVAERSLLSSG
ncbi:PARG family protein [Nocardiopsis sp. L17-MgMaSL7]|nr:PARG family protein [Nocardiopsis sp. L17-MgMaSL7]